ncbi:hypothetical protein AQUCO_00400324v1 [Aquilegia coerulea]|uniref:FAS1 domain-containing protein n=1 Tax=Aquilegia coerulea TaxID=218851 RepID=A0A2G5EUE9_AQUCA|nr:hypothetical protein AQUCO_00400324v1 [Aquilegia coerulea]
MSQHFYEDCSCDIGKRSLVVSFPCCCCNYPNHKAKVLLKNVIVGFLLHPTLGETSVGGFNIGRQQVENIVKAVSDAGYHAMALTLELTLPTMISIENTSSVFTIFTPPDQAFFSLRYPMTLLKYHVAPVKLERETFKSSYKMHSKIDTILHGHPLVVTKLPHAEENGAINGVKIAQWNIYNDGYIVVHGVDDFFDPSYQVLLYPKYDNNNNNKGESSQKGILQQVFDKAISLGTYFF